MTGPIFHPWHLFAGAITGFCFLIVAGATPLAALASLIVVLVQALAWTKDPTPTCATDSCGGPGCGP